MNDIQEYYEGLFEADELTIQSAEAATKGIRSGTPAAMTDAVATVKRLEAKRAELTNVHATSDTDEPGAVAGLRSALRAEQVKFVAIMQTDAAESLAPADAIKRMALESFEKCKHLERIISESLA